MAAAEKFFKQLLLVFTFYFLFFVFRISLILQVSWIIFFYV